MNLSGLVNTFLTGTYTVLRYGAATWGSDGRAVLPSPSSLSIPAAVFPLGQKELERLPEGLRTGDLRAVVTKQALQTTATGAAESDVITLEGFQWQVEQVEPWNVLGGFWWSVVRKIGN